MGATFERVVKALDAKGLTVVNMIDPVDGSTVAGLDLEQLAVLVDTLEAMERTIAKVNAYADDRSMYMHGTCGSMRVASDLYAITGATASWNRQ